MPGITIEGPELKDMNIKRELVKKITDLVEDAYKIPRDHITVTFKSYSPEDFAVGGTLLSDLRKNK
ncbi:MAG: tautomerase family protein [Promethearchaeota archaeon]